jgi:glyoxylase-like metal-dependent hydrolase (beta-lactamase superfamily II)
LADVIAPGVWWLHETRGSNVFVVEASDGQLVIIDCGFPSSGEGIAGEMARIAPGRSPSCILLTHAHVDHTGAAAALRERLGARVVAGAADCFLDEAGQAVLREPIGRSHRWRRFLHWLARSRPTAECVVDLPLTGECEIVPGVLAVPAPGHTPGSYCYIDTVRGIAFVGDLVISHRGRLTRPLRAANASDRRYLGTLREFAQRAPAAGCAGHGEPVMDDFAVALTDLAMMPRRRVTSLADSPRRFVRLIHFARMLTRTRRS